MQTENPTQRSSIALLREKLGNLLRERPVWCVLLFGSRARGEADEYSDTDLLIVAETDRPFPDRCRDYLDLLEAIEGPVEMLIYTPVEFERLRDEERPFIGNVIEEGIVVYESTTQRSRTLVPSGRE